MNSASKLEDRVENQERKAALELANSCQFLTFTVGNEEYGIDIMQVREIKGWADTTRLPNTPGYLRGVINLRGVVIPIFDLRGRFGMGETIPDEKNVVIIVAVGSRLIGILVDSVSDILSVSRDEIRPSPHMEIKIDDEYVNGLISVKEKMVVLLNIDTLFASDAKSKADENA